MRRSLIIALASIIPAQAHAVTAGDLLGRMSADKRNSFINGALDMLTYELGRSGQGDKASCITKWFYEGEGPRHVALVFTAHKDKPAVALLRVLADRHCK